MLGEQILVESEVGKGTCFSFTLKKYVSNAIALGPTADYIYDPSKEDNAACQDTDGAEEDVTYEVIKPKKTRKRTKKSKRTDSGKKDAR